VVAAAIGLAVVGAIVAGLTILPSLHRVQVPEVPGSGCAARAAGQTVPLAPSQAAIAATIAGVAQRQRLPVRALTIAYAAALQESKLQNLGYGDRDSVGVFQQRPSQGWGPRAELTDPVYATEKFFAALVAIPGYQKMPVYQAAQAVQRSADGSAYAGYQQMAAVLARAFSGRAPRAVWCWYPHLRRPRLSAAVRALDAAFGPVPVRAAGDPVLRIDAGKPASCWAVAAWLISHAPQYGIRAVGCRRFHWTAAHGGSGWPPGPAPVRRGTVLIG
jgi:hypothetical protein